MNEKGRERGVTKEQVGKKFRRMLWRGGGGAGTPVTAASRNFIPQLDPCWMSVDSLTFDLPPQLQPTSVSVHVTLFFVVLIGSCRILVVLNGPKFSRGESEGGKKKKKEPTVEKCRETFFRSSEGRGGEKESSRRETEKEAL